MKTWPSKLCRAKIKVLWLTSLNVIKIERYKDSSNHTHSLLEIDRIKRSQAIRSLVEKEAIKNYSPLAITSAIRKYATIELGLSASVNELKRKEVANIKYKIRGPMEFHLIGDSNLTSDISQSISYLIEKGYHAESYSVFSASHKSTKGIIFAHSEQLKKLQRYE